jgi:uncharacterized protein (DUF1501 family)
MPVLTARFTTTCSDSLCPAGSLRAPGRILVVFEWFGGNGSLNTIVPYGDPLYYKHRPTIGLKEKDLLKIDAHFGWHRSMRGIQRLYDEGKVAIVQGVGYDQPSFSHFTSMSFWHTAAPHSGNEYGWSGRTASALDPGGALANVSREALSRFVGDPCEDRGYTRHCHRGS